MRAQRSRSKIKNDSAWIRTPGKSSSKEWRQLAFEYFHMHSYFLQVAGSFNVTLRRQSSGNKHQNPFPTLHLNSAWENSYIMSSTALKELCQV